VVAGGEVGGPGVVVTGGVVVVEGWGTIWTGRNGGSDGTGGSRTPKPNRIITVTVAVSAWKYTTASRYWTRVLTILMAIVASMVADLDQRIPGEQASAGGEHCHARLATLDLDNDLAQAQRTTDRQHHDVPQSLELAHPSVSPPPFRLVARNVQRRPIRSSRHSAQPQHSSP
jgi:hypothetical protein